MMHNAIRNIPTDNKQHPNKHKTFIQRRLNASDVGTTLYNCYTESFVSTGIA